MEYDYEEIAGLFIDETKTNIDISFEKTVDGFPFDKSDKHKHNKYKVTMMRNGIELKFDFYGSCASFKNRTAPGYYEILCCLEKYDPGDDMIKFALEYGYSIESDEDVENIRNIYTECKEQYEKLVQMYNSEELDRLRMLY